MVNTILAKRVNHIVAKGDNPAWPKGSKSRGFSTVFVDEFLHPEKVTEESYAKHPNANKKWTRSADKFLLSLYHKGKSIKYIAEKMGRSQTSIIMRIGKLEGKQ